MRCDRRSSKALFWLGKSLHSSLREGTARSGGTLPAKRPGRREPVGRSLMSLPTGHLCAALNTNIHSHLQQTPGATASEYHPHYHFDIFAAPKAACSADKLSRLTHSFPRLLTEQSTTWPQCWAAATVRSDNSLWSSGSSRCPCAQDGGPQRPSSPESSYNATSSRPSSCSTAIAPCSTRARYVTRTKHEAAWYDVLLTVNSTGVSSLHSSTSDRFHSTSSSTYSSSSAMHACLKNPPRALHTSRGSSSTPQPRSSQSLHCQARPSSVLP